MTSRVPPLSVRLSRHAHVLSGLLHSNHLLTSKEWTLNAVTSEGVDDGDMGTH